MWSVRCLHTEAIECLPQALCIFPVLYMLMCVGACSCLCPCQWVCHMLVCEDREAHHVPSSLLFALFPWGRFFPEPGVLALGARLTVKKPQCFSYLHPFAAISPAWSYRSTQPCPAFHTDCRNLSSGPPACTARTLIHWAISPRIFFWTKIFHWTQSSQTQLDWLARETPGCSLPLPLEPQGDRNEHELKLSCCIYGHIMILGAIDREVGLAKEQKTG